MNKPVRLDDEAKDELSSALDWYDERRSGLGKEFLNAVEDVFRLIEQRPGVGDSDRNAPADLPIRRCLVRRFPYAVVFLELESEVRVLAVAHDRRRPGYWRSRVS